jgi:hypothetical protein
MAEEIKLGIPGFNSSDEKDNKVGSVQSLSAETECAEAQVFSLDAEVNFRINGWIKTSMIFLKRQSFIISRKMIGHSD